MVDSRVLRTTICVCVLSLSASRTTLADEATPPRSARSTEKAIKQSANAGELSASALYKKASPSVVIVEAKTASGISQGSGVVVGDGEIITNNHVIEGASGFVLVRQGSQSWRAAIVANDADNDLALLAILLYKTERFNLPIAATRAAASLQVGERAYAIGTPRGLALTLSEGLVSGLPNLGELPLIQTTAAISPGSSGGGLFDTRGMLIGVTTVYLRDSQNLNFAVASDHIKELQNERAEFEKDSSGYSLPSAPLEEAADTARTGLYTNRKAVDLPTALRDTRAVLVAVNMSGPIASQGGLTSTWATTHVVKRLKRSGIATYIDANDAARDGFYGVPLTISISSMHIEDSYLYTWQLEIALSDTADFSDGSNHFVAVWTHGTHGYGGSKVVVDQVSKALDQYVDRFSIDLLKSRQE